jgi:G:T-mismatch repair DNA endonuclease (very short patch repair protein)
MCADEFGRCNKLCINHAFKRGTVKQAVLGTSIVACEFMDRLSSLLNLHIEHKHLQAGVLGYEGSEHQVCTTKYRADGYIKESNTVIEFHGNAWHGFPEGHEKFDDVSPRTGKRNSTMYKDTMTRMQAIKALGYNVWFVWEHEFAAIRSKPLASVQKIIHVL